MIQVLIEGVNTIAILTLNSPLKVIITSFVNSREACGLQDLIFDVQGVAIPEFDTALQACSRYVVEDLRSLDQKIKSQLEWSNANLLRAIVAFIDNQNWVEREVSDEHSIVDPVWSVMTRGSL